MHKVKMLPTEAMKESLTQASVEGEVHWLTDEIIKDIEAVGKLMAGHFYHDYKGPVYLATSKTELKLIADYSYRKVGA